MTNKPVDKASTIIDIARGRMVLDVGFLNHSAEGFGSSFVHRSLYEDCELVGVDLVHSEMVKARDRPYKWIVADATKSLPFAPNSFDVIVAADLIEHLDDFRGFLENCRRLLRPKGKLIITTPNPFYIDNWLYTWLKSDVMVNSDHTCWVCPATMKHLLSRHKFGINKFYWIKHRWNLISFLMQTEECFYSHETSQWVGRSGIKRLLTTLLGIPWGLVRRLLTLWSPLNRWSDYMVVCTSK